MFEMSIPRTVEEKELEEIGLVSVDATTTIRCDDGSTLRVLGKELPYNFKNIFSWDIPIKGLDDRIVYITDTYVNIPSRYTRLWQICGEGLCQEKCQSRVRPPPPPPEYVLVISTITGGTTNPSPGSYTYTENTTAKVTAIPSEGWNFNHWILDGMEYTANPISIVMDSNHSLTAYFSEEAPPPPSTYNLTIITTEGGTTEPEPGIYEATAGDIITVTATPNKGYKFKRFELDGEVKMQNPINVGMDADHTLLAVFEVTAPPISTTAITLGAVAAVAGVGYVITRKKK